MGGIAKGREGVEIVDLTIPHHLRNPQHFVFENDIEFMNDPHNHTVSVERFLIENADSRLVFRLIDTKKTHKS